MTTFFVACATLGAAVLILQIVLGLFGLASGAAGLDLGFAAGETELEDGLHLLSVRALAAGLAFFGLGGLAALILGLPAAVALVVALVPGAAALLGTALLMRQMLRMESDGTLQVEGAVGEPATVYLPIPGGRAGPGKVLLALQGRTVELQAVTAEERPLPRGEAVIVVSVLDPDTVEVLPTSRIGELLDDNG